MNILTFDIEEWYIEKTFHSDRPEKYKEFDNYLNTILDVLYERQIKATFFCLGRMSVDFPDVVKKIVSNGHDIGCHSDRHLWLNKMAIKEALADTHIAMDSLEQCIGKKVKSYRAPAFSVGKNNKWMFEIFAEFGIESDSSIFPSARDFGGFPEFSTQVPSIVKYNGVSVKEYPIPMAYVLGKEIAYSGGGYFRLLPMWVVMNKIKKTDYTICYFHIKDFLPESSGIMSKKDYEAYFKEPGTIQNRYLRYFKGNVGKKSALEKFQKLIDSTDFINLEQADKIIDWSKAPVVEI